MKSNIISTFQMFAGTNQYISLKILNTFKFNIKYVNKMNIINNYFL